MNSKDLRIVYMGTPDFAVAPLRALVEGGYNVVAVVTSMDKPAGRGLKIQESAVKRYAVEAGLLVLQPEKLKSEEFVEQFYALNADLGIVIAFRMLPEIVWAAPRLGTFNLHASLLPQYRGAAPINWAVINGETETGITTFMLNHEIDKGDVIGRSRIAIDADETAGSLHDKLMNQGVVLVIETVEKIAAENVVPLPQCDTHDEKGLELKAAPKIFKQNCKIDWALGCAQIYNLVRGLSPYPAAWADCGEGLSAKIFACHPEYDSDDCIEQEASSACGDSTSCGDIVSSACGDSTSCGDIVSDGKTYMKVRCADGFLCIDRLQPAGKKPMTTEDFLRGSRPFAKFL